MGNKIDDRERGAGARRPACPAINRDHRRGIALNAAIASRSCAAGNKHFLPDPCVGIERM